MFDFLLTGKGLNGAAGGSGFSSKSSDEIGRLAAARMLTPESAAPELAPFPHCQTPRPPFRLQSPPLFLQ